MLAATCAAGAHNAGAAAVQVPDSLARPLGTQVHYLIEGDQPLDLDQAVAQQRFGKFLPGQQPVLNFGIGSRPVWVHLEVNNPDASPFPAYLMAGVTWLDRLDVYVMHAGQLRSRVHTGDAMPFAPGLTPVLGYVLPLQLAPGISDIYLRVESIDPMPLPIELMSGEQLQARQLHWGYYYGFFYGFLAALCAYNLLLFAGMGERSYLYYSLALVAIVFCNMSYTGHGVAWLWPGLPWFQRYVILVSMVMYSALGLLFASRFLALAEHAPRALSVVRRFSGAGLGAMVIALLVGSQLAAALVAFTFTGLFTVAVFLLGILALRQGRAHGRYFLIATFFGMLGVAASDLSVWGKIPFTPPAFHGVELGLVLEATLLALALAYRMRQYRQAGLMARLDPLTGLNNRRAFVELAAPCASAHERRERPLSLVLMDIDYFKQINDEYGHKAGDDVLVAVANLLMRHSRASDVVARWGGEEFILLLTETELTQAATYAERLRRAISELRVPAGGHLVSLTASFGIAKRSAGTALEDIINLADIQLYNAKREGRNRVCWDVG